MQVAPGPDQKAWVVMGIGGDGDGSEDETRLRSETVPVRVGSPFNFHLPGLI